METNEYLIKMIKMAKLLENVDLFMGDAKLSKTEFRLLQEVLNETKKGKQIISSELARRLSITRSAVSQMVTKLEERGIVKRVSSPTDRKIAYIQLSDRSMSVFEENCKKSGEFTEQVVTRFGKERFDNLIAEAEELFRIVGSVCSENRQK